MKKKIILLVVALAVLTATLAGCISKPPHKMFSDPWGNYEEISYKVVRTLKDEDNNNDNNIKINGTSTMITERLNNSSVVVGNRTLQNFSGSVVTLNTKLEDGSTMTSTVAFKSSFEPVASYKKIFVKGYAKNSPEKDTNQEISMYYNDQKCYYDTNIDGVKNKGEVKTGKWIKSPFYDNLMIYHIARSSYNKGSYTNLSSKVLSVNDYKMKNLSVTYATSTLVKLIDPNSKDDAGIKSDLIKISLQQKFPGSGEPLTVCLSKENKENYNGMTIKTDRVPIIITEDTMVYTITGYKTTK